MSFKEYVYTGTPTGLDKTTALIVLLINVITPGLGTILSAFLAPQCMNETVYVGIAQIITMPLLGAGFIWAMFWSVHLYRTAGTTRTDEEDPLIIGSDAPATATA